MRFEVLLRDAEIAFWQQVADNPEKTQQLRVELDRRQQRINDDFAFIAQSNIGGEYLGEHDKQRIKQIASSTWQQRLSNRMGLSPLEQKRLIGDEPRLPVMEALLSDRPEHLFPHQHDTGYDPSLGIKMPVPDYQYNQGELYNLLIERGTLTTEDRFKINEHIIGTIKMLESLPLPMELAKVPRYASTHHETMDGRGYPRQLHGDDLSIPERIMVLADIFEALTAADRPYKTAKTLSESLAIMHKMVLDQHIDRDVFELFLRSGVYLDYARRFLAPEQNDDVDINDYLQT
ncbi:hypothetical protein COL154_013885 [Colletotrichum chrysophilum]|nr:hypothetical protein COL154_013885 [Colletotrichum chrysophilum]